MNNLSIDGYDYDVDDDDDDALNPLKNLSNNHSPDCKDCCDSEFSCDS